MKPIDDKSDLSLVEIREDGHVYCKIHGAMNCHNVTESHRWYRCFSVYKVRPEDKHLPVEQRRYIDRACEAACMIPHRTMSKMDNLEAFISKGTD